MKLLLDTNIIIPLEPASTEDLEANTQAAALIARQAQLGGHTTYVHPAQSHDIDRDKDQDRAALRRVQISKYPSLPDPPQITGDHRAVIGSPEPGSNDWVDDHLLIALAADAVDFLVTEDKRLHKKARRLSVSHRVLTIDDAVLLLGAPIAPPAPPAVQSIKPHALDKNDPIFESFRADYPPFDEWFAKCCRDHRQTWVIDGGDRLAAICIVKENDAEPGLSLGHNPMKICSLKVAERFNGLKYGELLLKTVFDHASAQGASGIFVTAFEKHSGLIALFEDFGFWQHSEQTDLGEQILAKSLTPREGVHGLDYHVQFGPPSFDPSQNWHIVPIQPRYSDVLFPESAETQTLFPGQQPFGNAIRKAYLCHAQSRRLQPGDILAFYRTQKSRGIIAIGIVESTIVSRDVAAISRAVARRTVYSAQEIQDLCRTGEVLAIRFRQARLISPCRTPDELVSARVIHRAPQSIMSARKEGVPWLMHQFSA